jgi:hypothetical protein
MDYLAPIAVFPLIEVLVTVLEILAVVFDQLIQG